MIPLLKSIWNALWFDEMAARRWVRGGLFWVSSTVAQVIPSGIEAARTWTGGEWATVLGVGLIAGVAGMINLGDKNEPK